MQQYLQTAVLAIIQGLAELLPVSSTAHVILAQKLMGLDPSKHVFALVLLHTGTMGAVLVYFWPRWRRLLFAKNEVATAGTSPRTFSIQVIIATAATGVVGLLLLFLIHKITGESVEALFKNLYLIATALYIVGLLIIAAGLRKGSGDRRQLNNTDAVIIGLVQGVCLPFRGLSRSGTTISTGLFRDLSRSLAEDFSFALAILLTPPVIAYSLYKLVKEGQLSHAEQWQATLGPALAGMVMSFMAGLVALRLLSSVLEKGKWHYFGWYCLAFATVILLAAVSGY